MKALQGRPIEDDLCEKKDATCAAGCRTEPLPDMLSEAWIGWEFDKESEQHPEPSKEDYIRSRP
jgi:hypothetical protein